MTKLRAFTPTLRRRGFSLLETLVVIGIIGTLSGLAVALLTIQSYESTKVKNQRNAQTFCVMFHAATAAGADLAPEGRTKFEIMDELARGVRVGDSKLESEARYFRVPGLSEEEVLAASEYLSLTNKNLHYKVDGSED